MKKEDKADDEVKEKKSSKPKEMKEGDSEAEIDDDHEQERELIKFDNPYTYQQLLERINDIIKKNNTYSSRFILKQLKARISCSSQSRLRELPNRSHTGPNSRTSVSV